MVAIYDITTGRPMPVEDPPQPTLAQATDGMTDDELRVFWNGARWGLRLAGGLQAAAHDVEFVAESGRAVRDAQRSRLGVAR